MNHQHLASSFAAALLLALIYGPCAARAQTNANPATATISGRVTLGGQPARGIKVSLVPGPYGSPETPGRQSVRADEEGNYEFKGLIAGRYGVLAASYVYVSDELFSLPSKPFKLCTVAAEEKLTGQDIRLVRGGVITGRVTDGDGKPIILEPINLSFVEPSGKRQEFPSSLNHEMLVTDDRGVYRCFGLPPGRYLVSVGKEISGATTSSARDFYRRVYYPGVAEAELAELIAVSAGNEVTGIDLQLGPREKIFAASGRAIDAANGQGVPGAWTDFYLFDQRTKQLRPWSVGVPTNERGEFNFTGLLPGRYGVAGTPDITRNYYGELVAFEIKDEDLAGLEINLQRGANISGTVAIDGAADVAAALQRARLFLLPVPLNPSEALPRRDLPPAQVQANGGFQLKALPPGKLRLELSGGEHNFSLLRIERNGAVLQEAFDLKAGEQVTGVRVVLAQATGALRGRVVLTSADWLPEVSLRRVDGGEQLARPLQLDVNHSFLAPTLAVGEYEIVVTLTNKNSNDNQSLEPLRRRITVREGTTTEVLLQAR